MSDLFYDDTYLRDLLKDVRTIAMVGASAKPVRPSYFVMKYLQGKGYRILPVNPGLAGQEILGEKVYGSLQEIDIPYDMVDIFRNSEAAGKIADEILAMDPKDQAKVVWMQLTVRNDEAAAKLQDHGIKVVMNRCPKIEYGRLFGELGWFGINSKIITSKRWK